MSALNREEFDNLTKPLREMNLELKKANELFNQYRGNVINLTKKGYCVKREHMEEYNRLYSEMGNQLHSFLDNMQQMMDDLKQLNNKL